MQIIKTRINGGKSSLKEVADAWKSEVHDFAWSTSSSDAWAVEFGKMLNEKQLKEGPAKPDPRNIH